MIKTRPNVVKMNEAPNLHVRGLNDLKDNYYGISDEM